MRSRPLIHQIMFAKQFGFFSSSNFIQAEGGLRKMWVKSNNGFLTSRISSSSTSCTSLAISEFPFEMFDTLFLRTDGSKPENFHIEKFHPTKIIGDFLGHCCCKLAWLLDTVLNCILFYVGIVSPAILIVTLEFA